MIDPSEYARKTVNRRILTEAIGPNWKAGSRTVRNMRRQEIQRIALEAIDGFGSEGWDHVRVMFERARKTSGAFESWGAETSPFDYAMMKLVKRGFIEQRDEGPRLTELGVEALRDYWLLRRGTGVRP